MKVHIVGGDSLVEKMFVKHKFDLVDDAGDADIVCFTGGEDVSPEYYKEPSLKGTYSNPDRDEFEEAIFDANPDKFFVGICRGGQFLNVLSGGRLYQDVNNHAGRTHMTYDENGKQLCEVTSTHHQMMIPHYTGRVLAYAHESTTRVRARGVFVGSPFTDDVEVVFYPETKDRNGVLCFQPHPEYSHEPTERLFFTALMATNKEVKDFINSNSASGTK